jgi:hypothetical protein
VTGAAACRCLACAAADTRVLCAATRAFAADVTSSAPEGAVPARGACGACSAGTSVTSRGRAKRCAGGSERRLGPAARRLVSLTPPSQGHGGGDHRSYCCAAASG